MRQDKARAPGQMHACMLRDANHPLHDSLRDSSGVSSCALISCIAWTGCAIDGAHSAMAHVKRLFALFKLRLTIKGIKGTSKNQGPWDAS